jgi:hypothetical protein
MTTGTVKTQGTHLFMIETVSASDPTITKLVCPTGIQGLGGAKDQIETTCLDTTVDKEYVPGLGNPGQVTVPFNLIPRDTSHQILFTLKEAGTVLKWLACLSESTEVPTLDSDALAFITPTTRSSLAFDAYISDVNIDIANNEIVKGTLTLQRSGTVTPFWYEPS